MYVFFQIFRIADLYCNSFSLKFKYIINGVSDTINTPTHIHTRIHTHTHKHIKINTI